MMKYWIGILALAMMLMLCLGIVMTGCAPTQATNVLQDTLTNAMSNPKLYAGRTATIADADIEVLSLSNAPTDPAAEAPAEAAPADPAAEAPACPAAATVSPSA